MQPPVLKRRTRQHVIASQSVNHLERFIIDEGHTAHRFAEDYGYDASLITYDEHGYVEPGHVYFQLKASESWKVTTRGIVFDPDIRDHNLWRRELLPVVLMLYAAEKRRAFWLHVQPYIRDYVRPKVGAKTVRIWVPEVNVINRRAIRTIRRIKQQLVPHSNIGIYHE